MTIILPENRWARRLWWARYRSRRVYRKVRTFVDWKYPHRGPDVLEIRRVKIRHPRTGKKSWMVLKKVKVSFFRINTDQRIDPSEAIYLRLNPVEGQTDE